MDEFNPRKTPWRIDEADFYEIENREEQLRFLLRYAVLAPSSHNTQPWSFRINAEGIEVFADFERRLPIVDPGDRELLMSLGAAVANLRVAAAHFGYESTVLHHTPREDSVPIAVIALRETCAPDTNLARLFPAITQRHTNRQPFEEKAIDETALAAVVDFMEEHPSTMVFVVPHDRSHVADLVAAADGMLMSREPFRKELADWIRPNESSALDGMSADAFGIPGPLSALAPWMIRRFDFAASHAAHDHQLAENAAGLIAVTADDDAISLLRAGETLEFLLLILTTQRINYSFLNQPMAIAELRQELWSMLRSARPPQLLLRIGYGRPVLKPMPRRPVDVVMK